MASDDGDIESSKAPAGFGDVDLLSGFFTPVWESKKRIRSETPIPSSRRSKPSDPAPREAERGAAAPAARPSAKAKGEAKASPREGRAKSQSPVGAAPSGQSQPSAGQTRRSLARDDPREAAGGSSAPERDPAKPEESPRVAARPTGASKPALEATGAAVAPAADGRAPEEASSLAPQSRGALEVPPQGFLDEEPDFRQASAEAGSLDRTARKRSQRASAVATHLHEQLKARWRADAEREAKDTERDLKAVPAPPDAPLDPLSPHVVRRFRRTIALSSPLPEPLRSAVMRARSN